MRRTRNKNLAHDLLAVLDRAKRSSVQTSTHALGPAAIATLIAKGQITRERACDGKKRYRTYEYAEEVRAHLEPKYNKRFDAYACCFCNGYHLASHGEFAA